MKIAVVGAGGLGGYLGGLLARAGHDVAFLARGEHLRAIREAGLRIESPHGSFGVRPALATDDPAAAGTPGFEAELTIFTVKTYDTDVSAKLIHPWVGPHTAILPLQNGVESVPRLSQYFRPESVLGGAAWIVSSVAAPGVIRQESQIRRIVFGEQAGGDTPRLHSIRDVLAQSGFEVETTEDIEKVLWTKLVFIASFSGISSVTRAPAGPVLASSESRLLLLNAMREVEAAARARGVRLEADVVPQAMALAEGLAPTATSSMQRDVVAGRRLEYDAINGAVVRAGQAAGVPTGCGAGARRVTGDARRVARGGWRVTRGGWGVTRRSRGPRARGQPPIARGQRPTARGQPPAPGSRSEMESLAKPLLVEVVAYAPTGFYHCTHCEVVWKQTGFSQGVHEEQVQSALPPDLMQDYQVLSDWVHRLLTTHCDRVVVKVIDAASLEGVWKSARHRLGRYPAVLVGGRRFVGTDFTEADAEIARQLDSLPAG